MQGRQEYQPELFTIINIEAMIPQNHLLRKLERLLDLTFVREMTAKFYCNDNGRPSVDPELFFRMQLIAVFYNIDSDRRLCSEVEFNLAYRWYCKLSLNDGVPDHSSLTNIRDRLGEETYKNVFEKILQLCRDKGLLKNEVSIFTDGSLVKADASMKSIVKRDEDGNPLPEREVAWHAKGQTYSNKTHVSKSDPDSSLASKPGNPKALYYKIHASADQKSRIIVDCQVTTGGQHDTTMFTKQIDTILERGFKIKHSTADRAYGGAENLLHLEDKNIEHSIPLFRPEVGVKEEGFTYNAKKDIYICPEGHKMHAVGGGDAQKAYQISLVTCRICPRRDICLPPGKYKTFRGKKINRSNYQNLFERVLEKEKTKEFRSQLHERMWSMEGLFAEGKTFHGLDRARYRGRWKVQAQAYLVSSVQNLKRLMASLLEALTKVSFFKFNFYKRFSMTKINSNFIAA